MLHLLLLANVLGPRLHKRRHDRTIITLLLIDLIHTAGTRMYILNEQCVLLRCEQRTHCYAIICVNGSGNTVSISMTLLQKVIG